MARTGGRAPRKLAEMSSASSECAICGNTVVRKGGTEFGVGEDPISR